MPIQESDTRDNVRGEAILEWAAVLVVRLLNAVAGGVDCRLVVGDSPRSAHSIGMAGGRGSA